MENCWSLFPVCLCFFFLISLFSFTKKGSFAPRVPRETCGSDRWADCFIVHRSLAVRKAVSGSDPLPSCQTVPSAPCSCYSEPVSEVTWLRVLSAVRGAILDFAHVLQAYLYVLCCSPVRSARFVRCTRPDRPAPWAEAAPRHLHAIPAASETCGYKGTGSQAVVRGA